MFAEISCTDFIPVGRNMQNWRRIFRLHPAAQHSLHCTNLVTLTGAHQRYV